MHPVDVPVSSRRKIADQLRSISRPIRNHQVFRLCLLAVTAMILYVCVAGAQTSGGGWRLISEENSNFRAIPYYPSYYLGVTTGEVSNGKMSVQWTLDYNYDSPTIIPASVSWNPPPAFIQPGDIWNLHFQNTGENCKMSNGAYILFSNVPRYDLNAPASMRNSGWDIGKPWPSPIDLVNYPYLIVEITPAIQFAASNRFGLTIETRTDRVYVHYYYCYKWSGDGEEPASQPKPGSAPTSGGTPWKTVAGIGAAAAIALAAAAKAIAAKAAAAKAAAAASARKTADKKAEKNEDPGRAVGYVLQLSNDRLTLNSDESVTLTATVWAVDSRGTTALASAAAISLSAPAGIIASPAAGSGRVVTHLRATPELAQGTHMLAVTAQAGGSTYSASVSIVASVTYVYALELTPSTINLQRDGRETVRARVRVTGPDPAECDRESQRLASAIAFVLTGTAANWFAASDHAEGGGKSGYLDLTMPDNIAKLPGPHTATYTAQVDTPSGRLSQSCAITITTSQSFEIAMDQRLRLQANDVAGSLAAIIRALDDQIPDAVSLIARATPAICFAIEGPFAHWLREDGGQPGALRGEVSGGTTPGKEVHPLAEVPFTDLFENPPFNASIIASVDIPSYGSFTQAAAVEIVPPKWFVELQPIKDKLKIGTTDAALFRARVLPEDERKLSLYMDGGANALNQFLKLYADGKAQPYTLISERENASEFREYEVRLGEAPKGTDLGECLDLVAEATLCGQSTSQRFRINLSPKPRLETAQKTVTLVSEGESVELKLKVVNGDEFQWGLKFNIEGAEEVDLEGPPESDDRRAFILRLRAGEGPVGSLGVRSGKLSVTAAATHPETGEEIVTDPLDVTLKVGQVGLSILPSPVRLASDPAGPPATFKVRVVRYNEATKAFECMSSAMKSLDLGEWEDGEAENGANVFKGADVTLAYVRSEGSGLKETAIWTAKSKLVIPAFEPLDALRELTAPGDWGDAQSRFTLEHRFIAPVDPASEMAHKISVEQARCRKILEFIPNGPEKEKFREVIERDAKNLGVEGLVWQRKLIWTAARDSLMRDARNYRFAANVADAAVQACDWVNYICGLIVQGLSSAYAPFPVDMFITMLYGALPEFTIAASEGRARQWPNEWLHSLWAGAPDMAVDASIGMLINLEDLVKQGYKELKDIRKAFIAACIVFWSARFARWYNSSTPDGEPYSFKDAVLAAVRELAEEVINTGIGKNATFRKQGIKEPGALDWIKDYDPTTGHGYDPKDGSVYHETTTPPDTRGMPAANLEAAKKIARNNNVEIYIRPTNPASKALLEMGALPKPEKIKAKTINELDLKLGRKAEDLGKVGYFDPGPKPPERGNLTKEQHKELVDRYKQRKQEWVDNQKDFEKLSHDHMEEKPDGTKVTERVTVDENGVVTNHTTIEKPDGSVTKSSKPYTGDHDVYDIRDNSGRAVTGAQYDKVVQELKDSKYLAQHPGHRQWDYSKLDKHPPPPKKDAMGNWQQQQSKFKKAKGIDEKIRDSHQSTTKDGKPGEALIKVGTNGEVSGAFHNSPATMQTHSTAQRAGQAISSADRDRRGQYREEP
jgi:hypothetical protein